MRIGALCLAAAALIGVLYAAAAPSWAQVRIEADPAVVVNIVDRDLSRRITVESARFARVGPVVRVQLRLANTRAAPVDVQYSAQWMDDQGFEVRTNNRWEPARIDGATSRSIDLLGNSDSITSVVVNVKMQ